MPRLSLKERDAIKNPATGLMVFQTDENKGFYFFNGDVWESMSSAGSANSIAGTDGDWTIVGNGGTTPASHFIGTLDNQGLRFRTNSNTSGYLSPDDGTLQAHYGYRAGNMDGGNSGVANASFGFKALTSNTTGAFNLALGTQALVGNTTGGNNIGIGTNSLANNTTGGANVGIGADALGNNVGGSGNIAIGNNALKGAPGSSLGNNIAIGAGSGLNATGNGNVFIGADAGANETGNGKLYINTGSSDMPLIYGDFAAKYVTIGDISPAQRTQGVGAGPNANYKLLVQGGILTEKVKVALASTGDWADYVFEKDYKLMDLVELEGFINNNKHLPNVPSAEGIVESGLDVGETSRMFMEKIEELTLYLIEMNKEIQSLKAQNIKLKQK
ncbi:MAG: hypothetical protein NXI00_17365 [Cytophagales bacterium]|nr:hypothetical protein [Cytophagales bacterium]